MKLLHILFFSLSLCYFFSSCTKEETETITESETIYETDTVYVNDTTLVEDNVDIEGISNNSLRPNILLIIADDLGKDATPGFLTDEVGLIKANMPVLDSLRNSGIRFTNLWTTPVCSPTRATLLTGKYGYHTGVFEAGDNISTTETTVQQLLNNYTSGYASAIIGKWHLTDNYSDPNLMGVDYFAGIEGGGVSDYYNWELVVNGGVYRTMTNEYITSVLTDMAIDWVNDQTKPWFLWMAYNAPHTPFHEPPSSLHTRGTVSSDQEMFLAAAEAMDTEMGRLINAIPEEERNNTIILYLGDNGTPGGVAQRYSNTKGSIWQGGVNMPMVVSGVGVSRTGETDASLINSTDFFTTIADIAGTGIDTMYNSVSFKDLLTWEGTGRREYVYTEVPGTTNKTGYAIRNDTLKYMRLGSGNKRVFDLVNDPFEENGILNALTDSQKEDTTALGIIMDRIRQ